MKKLGKYAAKRDFTITPEPLAQVAVEAGHSFVVQKHAASRLHYDFRLELDGVLRSWAVPKGPSLSPGAKRLAVEVEDHPIDYRDFEGTIPQGQYGGGDVLVWDRGTWAPVGDPHEGLRKGHLRFALEGEKLKGEWSLVRLKPRDGEKQTSWLLLKSRDEHGREGKAAEITLAKPGSVLTGRTIEEVGAPPAGPRLSGRASAKFEPQLATLVDQVPTGAGWVYEIKLDGYRIISVIEGGKARMLSRNGLDWTARFSDIAARLGRLRVKNAVIDGEVCFTEDDGKTSFSRLQNALSEHDQSRFVYFGFDLLYRDGEDLRDRPLLERKEVLATIFAGERAPLQLGGHAESGGVALYEEAGRLGLEGIVAKRADAPYTSGRSRAWLKIKCGKRQELVIIGYTAPAGKRTGLGALVLGVNDPPAKGALRYVCKVGTGFTERSLLALRRKLEPLARAKAPVANAPRLPRVTWVEPELVCEVGFTEWTPDGALRHPTFLGLREDKPTKDVIRERAARLATPKKPRAVKEKATKTAAPASVQPAARAAPGARRSAGSGVVEGVTITHEQRVLDEGSGITKGDLARYYAAVSTAFLPHAARRPLSILRCTDRIDHQCFFQKHAMPGMGGSVQRSTVGDQEVLSITSATGLLDLVQLGAIELHAWGARLPAATKPDRIVLDLDPDEGLPFGRVVEAALEAREVLRSIGLESWVKTTGGKGLHVVVPIQPRHPWDIVKKLAKAIAEDFARRAPDAFTATLSKSARRGRIFIDYLRNGEGATAVLPYSARARAGLTVALPIAWEDVRRVHPKELTIRTVPALLAKRRRDPWRELLASKQRLPPKLDALLAKTLGGE